MSEATVEDYQLQHQGFVTGTGPQAGDSGTGIGEAPGRGVYPDRRRGTEQRRLQQHRVACHPPQDAGRCPLFDRGDGATEPTPQADEGQGKATRYN